MKKVGFIVMLALALGACKDKVTQRYKKYQPVYTDYETFRQSATMSGPRSITEVGQIYVKDSYLLIIENDEGFHVIDNAYPENPQNIGFVELMGCTGLSIRGDQLYANSFIDLVVFDVSNMTSPTEVGRVEDAFPLALPHTEKNYPQGDIDKNLGVVTSWNLEEVEEDIDDDSYYFTGCFNCDFVVNPTMELATFDAASGSGSVSTGVAGSITKFTMIGDYLYVMDGWQLIPFDLTNPVSPVAEEGVYVWGDEVETLFPYEDYIFMGTPSGMNIYDTQNPAMPQYVSRLSHARGCDPVVVQDDIAYVTVRSGGPCGGTINQMDVIDVSNMTDPNLMYSYDMKNPHGLGIDGNTLMVCDGDKGLRVFDASNPASIADNELKGFKNIQATDVIPMNGLAIMIGDDGLYQYDYTDLNNIELISKIKF